MTLSEFLVSPEGRERSHTAWAAEIGVSKSYFSELASETKRPGVDVARRIDATTGGAVPWTVWFEEKAA